MGNGAKFTLAIFAILIVGLGIFLSLELGLLDYLIGKNEKKEKIQEGRPPEACEYRGKRLVCEYHEPLPLKYYMNRERTYNLGENGEIFTRRFILGLGKPFYREGYIDGKKAAKSDINKHYPTLFGFGGALIGGFLPGGFVACSLGLPSSIPQEQIAPIKEKSDEYEEGYRDGYLEWIKKAWNKRCWNGVWTATFIGMIIIWLILSEG